MNRKQYDELLATIDEVDDQTFEAMAAFAKAKKIKRPVRPEPKKRTARPAKKEPRVLQRDLTCSADGCDRPAIAKGMCSKHHTAWWRAQNPARQERAREASRRYAARKRAEREAAKAK